MVTQKAEKLPYEAEKSYYREQLRPCCFESLLDDVVTFNEQHFLHVWFIRSSICFTDCCTIRLDVALGITSIFHSNWLDFVNFSFEYNETIVAFQVGWVIQVLRITGAIFNNWEIFYFNSMGPLSKGLSRASVGSITMVFWFLETNQVGIFHCRWLIATVVGGVNILGGIKSFEGVTRWWVLEFRIMGLREVTR